MYLSSLILALVWACGATGESGLSGDDRPDYPALFGADWRRAEQYAASERAAWGEIFEAFGVDAQVAEAVVFPEMVRYSVLRDVVETAATRARYQQRGCRGADFSIGRFQMKPSFVERVEREWMAWPPGAEWGLAFNTAASVDARRARVRRMDDALWQCTYLAMFLRLLYERNAELAAAATTEQVRLCAAAYNGGVGDLARAAELAGKRFFHTDFLPGPRTRHHSYSDMAAYYYSRHCERRSPKQSRKNTAIGWIASRFVPRGSQ
jgi:hypothetical protein